MFLKSKDKKLDTLVFVKEDLCIHLESKLEKKKSFTIFNYLVSLLNRL